MTTKQVVYMLLAMLVAAAVSFASTPMVKALACKVGAIDVPKDNRRMHKVPISRVALNPPTDVVLVTRPTSTSASSM